MMENKVKSLWEIPFSRETKTPQAILAEQAELVRPATGGIINGDVKVQEIDGNISCRLVLSAKNVETEFVILTVIHEVGKPYPATLQSEDLKEKIREKILPTNIEIERFVYPQAFNEQMFVECLKRAINGRSSQAAISSLLSLNRDALLKER